MGEPSLALQHPFSLRFASPQSCWTSHGSHLSSSHRTHSEFAVLSLVASFSLRGVSMLLVSLLRGERSIDKSSKEARSASAMGDGIAPSHAQTGFSPRSDRSPRGAEKAGRESFGGGERGDLGRFTPSSPGMPTRSFALLQESAIGGKRATPGDDTTRSTAPFRPPCSGLRSPLGLDVEALDAARGKETKGGDAMPSMTAPEMLPTASFAAAPT
mmetsp:Transcript_3314/g.10256  ORF Transcript_3314/g.10256 Transcript_3314/m.10256 type:complete len:214 (-) Transcript_3314:2249-2890(-)